MPVLSAKFSATGGIAMMQPLTLAAFYMNNFVLGPSAGILHVEAMPEDHSHTLAKGCINYAGVANPALVPVVKVTKNFSLNHNQPAGTLATLVSNRHHVWIIGVVYNGTDPGSIVTDDGTFTLESTGPRIRTAIFRCHVDSSGFSFRPGTDLWVYTICIPYAPPTPWDSVPLPFMNIHKNNFPGAFPIRGDYVFQAEMGDGPTPVPPQLDPLPKQSYTLGGSRTNERYVDRHLGGTQITNIAALLRIPCLFLRLLASDAGAIPKPIIIDPWKPSGPADQTSLWWYITLCFVTATGGVDHRFTIIGEGSVEIRRVNAVGLELTVGSLGAERANCYSKPTVTVRNPFQYNHEFIMPRAAWTDTGAYEHVMLYAHQNNVILNVERIVADDFCLNGFRGATRLKFG